MRMHQYVVGKDRLLSLNLCLKGCVQDAEDALDDASQMPVAMLTPTDTKEVLRKIRAAKAKLNVIAKLIKS
jgi:hypothetical protein